MNTHKDETDYIYPHNMQVKRTTAARREPHRRSMHVCEARTAELNRGPTSCSSASRKHHYIHNTASRRWGERQGDRHRGDITIFFSLLLLKCRLELQGCRCRSSSSSSLCMCAVTERTSVLCASCNCCTGPM